MSIKYNKNFNKVKEMVSGLSGKQQISLEDLFTDDFIIKYTEFKSLKDLFSNSGYKLETEEDFKITSSEEWNRYIGKVTQFSNWNEMISYATGEYYKKFFNI